jgi:hypothetical protein
MAVSRTDPSKLAFDSLARQNTVQDENDYAISVRSTEIETDTEDSLKYSGMIWTGYYMFDIADPPGSHSGGCILGESIPGAQIELLITVNGK